MQGMVQALLDRAGRFPDQDLLLKTVAAIEPKATAILHFITQGFRERENLRLVDIGGYAGFIGFEVALRCPQVSRYTNVDPIAWRTVELADFVLAAAGEEFASRCQRVVASAQQYGFDEPVDIIIALGSLLHVPRDELQATLDRAWSSLRGGGIFVVYENAKRDNYIGLKLYPKMFEDGELDAFLVRYGAVRKYSATNLKELPAEFSNTCYRTVQKP